MQNIIAIIWDYDKTLVNGYMQDPIFKEYGVDAKKFWSEVNLLPEKYKEKGIKVNKDTIYLNHFIKYTKDGKFSGLNNQKLRDFGKVQEFYPGIPEIFEKTKKIVDGNPKYREYNIRVEHYVVSTGMTEIIRGSNVAPYVESIWGCELIENNDKENKIISEIGYTLDNTTKTRALFEINKGIPQNPDIDVNAKMTDEHRRVAFSNMIYIADGPSDIPAFSVINKFGGATFAIYPKGDERAFKQVEKMREDGRINMYAEANYSEGTTAYMWITYKVKEIAEKIYNTEKAKLRGAISQVPTHLIND